MTSSTNLVKIGPFEVGKEFVVIAGPCSVESREQFLSVAQLSKEAGACMLRGGLFKLRTNPDSFQGMGREAFALAKEVKLQTQMPFFSEITDPRQIGDLYDVVDVFQVGSRNMHNYSLLQELGKTDKPILLKRGFAGLIDEWLKAAQYISKGGNDKVILCERGIRTFETCTRNTFDLNAIAYVKQNSNFPVIADPSHATGISSLVEPMSLAAAAAGADGLIIETHNNPQQALSDGDQAITPTELQKLIKKLDALLQSQDRRLAKPAGCLHE